MGKRWCFLLFLTLSLLCLWSVDGARKGGRRKGKLKNLFPFANAAAYVLTSMKGDGDPRAARLVKTSHFTFSYMLGGKIWMVCACEGSPKPTIVWYKDGADLFLKPHMHLYEKDYTENTTLSKLEIDPGTLGDSGIYTCYASNEHGMMYKNFKVEPNI